MHTATLLVVTAVFVGVLALGAENVTVYGPFTKAGPYGDHYGAFSLCSAASLFGGNRYQQRLLLSSIPSLLWWTSFARGRPEESVLASVYRVPMNTTYIGSLHLNPLPRNRNVTGNVALLLGFRHLFLFMPPPPLLSALRQCSGR